MHFSNNNHFRIIRKVLSISLSLSSARRVPSSDFTPPKTPEFLYTGRRIVCQKLSVAGPKSDSCRSPNSFQARCLTAFSASLVALRASTFRLRENSSFRYSHAFKTSFFSLTASRHWAVSHRKPPPRRSWQPSRTAAIPLPLRRRLAKVVKIFSMCAREGSLTSSFWSLLYIARVRIIQTAHTQRLLPVRVAIGSPFFSSIRCRSL